MGATDVKKTLGHVGVSMTLLAYAIMFLFRPSLFRRLEAPLLGVLGFAIALGHLPLFLSYEWCSFSVVCQHRNAIHTFMGVALMLPMLTLMICKRCSIDPKRPYAVAIAIGGSFDALLMIIHNWILDMEQMPSAAEEAQDPIDALEMQLHILIGSSVRF